MAIRNISDISKKINSLLQKYQAEIKKENNLAEFIELFFAKVLHDELILRDDQYLFDLAKSCFAFLHEKKSTQPKIKIIKQDKQHTIIELITTDMPFIVDSLVAEINNLGFEVTTIINRVLSIKRNKLGILEKIYIDNNDDNDAHNESVIYLNISYSATSQP
jgi:glutamate dehydrogenase